MFFRIFRFLLCIFQVRPTKDTGDKQTQHLLETTTKRSIRSRILTPREWWWVGSVWCHLVSTISLQWKKKHGFSNGLRTKEMGFPMTGILFSMMVKKSLLEFLFSREFFVGMLLPSWQSNSFPPLPGTWCLRRLVWVFICSFCCNGVFSRFISWTVTNPRDNWWLEDENSKTWPHLIGDMCHPFICWKRLTTSMNASTLI